MQVRVTHKSSYLLGVCNFANYRPVSNIGFVSKVLERYVTNTVRELVDNNGYNDAFQSAYRPRHSTETAQVRIHNSIQFCRRAVLLVLLDLIPRHTGGTAPLRCLYGINRSGTAMIAVVPQWFRH